MRQGTLWGVSLRRLRIEIPKLKRPRLQLPRMIWPLRLILYFATFILSATTIANVALGFLGTIASGIAYAAAACMLFGSVCYLYRDIVSGINEKIRPGIEANPYTYRIVKDYRYRTVLSAYASLIISIGFAAYNALFGIINRSVWFGALASYYIMLSIMRFCVVQYDRKASAIKGNKEVAAKEWRLYRNCGILLIILTFALGASVIQMVFFSRSKNDSESLVIAAAAYTFYKIITALIHIVKAGKLKSKLLISIRNIGFADALVSVLSLQISMFLCFGNGKGEESLIMNCITGAAVCLILLVLGIYMVVTAKSKQEAFE